jgi:hypothetical protein
MPSKILDIPYAKCTIMGFVSNMIVTSNCSTTCKVMNEFVNLKYKKQHTNLLFILHLNFSKLG